MKRTIPAVLLAVWCAAASATAPPTQPPATDQKDASLTVRVVLGADQAPVPRARVHVIELPSTMTARQPGPLRQFEADTNQSGVAVFAGLGAGRYGVSITAVGGFVRSVRVETVEVSAHARAQLVFRVERGGSVTGRVVDHAGVAVVRARVRAVPKDALAVAETPNPPWWGAAATTDERGQFRIFDLRDGEYYVGATYTPLPPSPSAAEGQPAGPQTGFQISYHPAATALADARTVTIGPGDEVSGVDITMLQGPVASVSVLARDAEGKPFPAVAGPDSDVSVDLVSAVNPVMTFPLMGRAEGRFQARAVPYGEYRLLVTVYDRPQRGVLRPRDYAYMPVSVSRNIVDLPVRVNAGTTIRGQVVIAPDSRPLPRPGGVPIPWTPPRMTVSAVPAAWVSALGSLYSTRWISAGEDGRFEIPGVRGPVYFLAMGAAITSVRRGGQDITCSLLEVSGDERIDDIQIEVSTRLGSIDGTSTYDEQTLEHGAWAIAIPVDPPTCPARDAHVVSSSLLGPFPPANLSPEQAERGAAAGPGRARFYLGNLLPGRYAVVVVNRDGQRPPSDPAELAKLAAGATIVTVIPASAPVLKVDLQLKK